MMAMLWADIERDLASSRRHFTMAIDMFAELRGRGSGRDQYMRVMAFLHAMQSGYTSFEAGIKRLLSMLDEPVPTGSDWHRTLIRRVGEPALGSRPALLAEAELRRAVNGLLGFRHVAAHVYDEFDEDRAALAVENARTYLAGIVPAMQRFRAVVDPE